ncbi:MAG TPA: SDR family NAD(P)-dependent oxidoreductase [Acidothermaceae bacterium]
MTTQDLSGSRVLVTGAARGIGLAIVRYLVDSGASVFAVDTDTAGLAQAFDQTTVCTRTCDVSDEVQVRQAVAAAAAKLGGLDGVVNSAAIVAVTRKPAEGVGVYEFNQVMAVNVRGPWLVYRAALPVLTADGGGSVVNLASEVAYSGSTNLAHYVASKAAVVGLTRALAREAGASKVRVNAVAPGFTNTEGARAIGDPDSYDTTATPLGRVGHPDDVVGAVAFLLSAASGFITGQVLLVNGGRVMA